MVGMLNVADDGSWSGAPYADMGPGVNPAILALIERQLGGGRGSHKPLVAPAGAMGADASTGLPQPPPGMLQHVPHASPWDEAGFIGQDFSAMQPPAATGPVQPPAPLPAPAPAAAPPPMPAPTPVAAPPVNNSGGIDPGIGPGPVAAPAAAPGGTPDYSGAPYANMGAGPVPPTIPVPESMTTPPNAGPTAGGAGNLSLNPTSLLGRLGKALGENSNTLLMMGAGLAGSGSWGQGLSRGLAGAAAGAQADRVQKNQNLTVEALKKRGLPDDLAEAAASNPEIMKQLVPQMFGAKQQQHVTIKDRMGNEIPLSYDPASGKYRYATGEAYGTPGARGGVSSTGDPNKFGKEYLDTLDPLTRNEVKAFGEYRAPVTARNLQTLLPLVTQAYPGFDATQYGVRVNLRKSYEAGGKDFQENQALNTVSGHMLKLADAADNLKNTPFPIVNKGVNWFRDTFTGSPEMTKFRNALVTTSNELAKAYHGGHVSDASYAAFQKGINEAQTPADMKAAIGEISGLLRSKIEAKESGYRTSMGDVPIPEEYKAMNAEAREAYGRIGEWALGGKLHAPAAAPAPAAPKPAPAMKPGTYNYDPNTGGFLRQQ